MPSQTDQPQSQTWNLWEFLDPERWARPVLFRRHALFIGYLVFLMILYVAYIHHCERRVRQISKIEKSNLELRSQYLFLKTELVRLGQLERVIQRASVMGFKEMRVPPLALGYANLRTNSEGNNSGQSTRNVKTMQP
jgi:hypothetical protein